MKKLFLLSVWVFSLLFSGNLFCEQVFVQEIGYYLELPAAWELLDAEDINHISFTDPNHAAVFQVWHFPIDSFSSVTAMVEQMGSFFSETWEAEDFLYSGNNAAFGNIHFQTGETTAVGKAVYLESENGYFWITGFAYESYFSAYEDFLISCIDSFSLSPAYLLDPGPVSQFLRHQSQGNFETAEFPFQNESHSVQIHSADIRINQEVIEREARILSTYATGNMTERFLEAWKRYYRMVYRDTYTRLMPFARAVRRSIRSSSTDSQRIPQVLLSWFQDFTYQRRGGTSDLDSPVNTVLTSGGDCDSRALAYVTMLQFMNIDSIFLVSHRFSHALVGVLTDHQGATFPYQGSDYVIAELTDNVDLGLIPRDMADPSAWVPIDFTENEGM
ncbi:MAG: hypothetical protein ACLFR1_08175 [Spirochaetia bacterium]